MVKTAILVDGGFYRKRARRLWGKKSGIERASELYAYCQAHLNDKHETRSLYRVFYYDCPPIENTLYHPLMQKNINMKHTDTYKWTIDFFEQLRQKRKVALRLGTLSDNNTGYLMKPEIVKKLCSGALKIEDLSEEDFDIAVEQRGVDMKIGIDIASLAYKKQVDQIILISGDSDFVPAAKLARREGIDFILDPMWADIKEDLHEHIDGLRSNWKKKDK